MTCKRRQGRTLVGMLWLASALASDWVDTAVPLDALARYDRIVHLGGGLCGLRRNASPVCVDDPVYPGPVRWDRLHDVVDIVALGAVTCVLHGSGKLRCVRLGDGTDLAGWPVVAVGIRSIVLGNDGFVYALGADHTVRALWPAELVYEEKPGPPPDDELLQFPQTVCPHDGELPLEPDLEPPYSKHRCCCEELREPAPAPTTHIEQRWSVSVPVKVLSGARSLAASGPGACALVGSGSEWCSPAEPLGRWSSTGRTGVRALYYGGVAIHLDGTYTGWPPGPFPTSTFRDYSGCFLTTDGAVECGGMGADHITVDREVLGFVPGDAMCVRTEGNGVSCYGPFLADAIRLAERTAAR